MSFGQVFVHQHRVTYSSCTLGNHVYYGRYLDILEEARGEFFRALGHPFLQLQEQNLIFPVVECSLRYRAPARYDQVLRIEVWIEQLTRLRLSFGCRISRSPTDLVLEARTDHVACTTEEKPTRMPVVLLEALRPYLSEPATTSSRSA